MNEWYPSDPAELERLLENYLSAEGTEKQNIPSEKIHGLIVPHAGYQFSGAIAGKAFSLLKGKSFSKAVIFGPSHYSGFYGLRLLERIETPLGKSEIIEPQFLEGLWKVSYEHSIDNQIPFLQKLNPDVEILPLVVGEITLEDGKNIAEKILEYFNNENVVYIFSTDLSHFLPYDEAITRDKKTISIIENLNLKEFESMDACGKFPLLIMMHLCIVKGWKPQLIEYKNSGDVAPELGKDSVVGYASFWF